MQAGSWTTRPTRSPGARACAAPPTTTARCGHLLTYRHRSVNHRLLVPEDPGDHVCTWCDVIMCMWRAHFLST